MRGRARVEKVSTARVTWRKSTRSNGSGNCVEMADFGGRVGVRDSKNVAAGVLVFAPVQWSTFVASIKGGQFTT